MKVLQQCVSLLWVGLALVAGSLSVTAGEQDQDLQEVLVTGSRVISNGNNSPTPVTVISTSELLEMQPTTVAAALQNIPVFQGSMGQNTGTGGSNAGPNGTANAVNIRNLGITRTLILYDGNRLQPTSDTGAVTLDFVPEMLLQRVDVVTGGVSAVYGSDAISGVVNFVTDKSFNGVKLRAQRGESSRHDDRIMDIGIAAGAGLFDGRGHVEGSFEYFNDPGIFDMSSRSVGNRYVIAGANIGSSAAAGSAANPYTLYGDARLSSTSFGGLITNGALNGQSFAANGILAPFRAGAATGTSGVQVGGDGGYYFNTSLKGALVSRRAFARFDYDLTDSTHFYLQGLGAKYSNTFQNQSLSFTNVMLSRTNAFLPQAYQTAMGTAANFTLSKIPQQLGPHRSRFDMESYQLFTGVNGKLGNYG